MDGTFEGPHGDGKSIGAGGKAAGPVAEDDPQSTKRVAPQPPVNGQGGDAPADLAAGGMMGALRRKAARLRRAWSAKDDAELDAFLSLGDGAEPRHDSEHALLMNVMTLRDKRVDDVMIPRAEIVAVELGATLEETLEAFRTGAHSRLPVYRENLDDPVGVVHLKDLALEYGFGGQEREGAFSLGRHLRSIQVVPPSMRIQALLQRMQATRRHMALVIDEYGGVDGLLTIEDLIEQIVGEIEDEHDDAEGPLWSREADGAYVAEARLSISEFADETGLDLRPVDWEEEADTLGGLVFTLSGRVPERGEVIPHPAGVEFVIVDADPRRIKRLRVRRAKKATLPAPVARGAAETSGETPAAPADAAPAAPETDAQPLKRTAE